MLQMLATKHTELIRKPLIPKSAIYKKLKER